MKILQSILIVFLLALCPRAIAETPVQAYGVTIVGLGGTLCAGTGNAGLRCTNLSTHPYVLLGGWYAAGDGGGGYFALGASGCTDNGGTILKDSVGDCFYRTDQRAAIPVEWFGAKCDAISTVYGGGTLAAGSNTFAPTAVTFQSSDVGKVIEFFPAGSVNPFRTTITAVNTSTNTVTVGHTAYNNYPGNVTAKNADFVPQQTLDGLDSPGTGYKPNDVLRIEGGTYSSQAQVTVLATGLVSYTQTSGGTGYIKGDLISLRATAPSGVKTERVAQLLVTSVISGVVQTTSIVSYGRFGSSSGSNPTAFVATGGHGSGFAISVSGDGNFGVSKVSLYVAGSYVAPPSIPATTTDLTTGSASGATVDLAFPTPYFVYGSDDTTAFQNLETYMENDANRGLYSAAEVPSDHACFLQTLLINRAVTWRSSGSRQAQLMQVIGSSSSTVDNTRYGFIVVAANYPSFDTFQDTSIGQTAVGWNNISILGGTTRTTVDVGSTQNQSYTNDGVLFQNATGKANTNVNAAIQNLQVANFPGNALSAYYFSGEFRAYNVYAGNAGQNCLDIEHVSNPTRFYGFVASGCTSSGSTPVSGINIVSSKTQEFHGASVFGNDIGVSVTGTRGSNESYIVFDNLQLGHSTDENMYLDQQNETVVCVANCTFKDANTGNGTGDADSTIVIGPDATTMFGGTQTILRLNQGYINPPDNPDSGYLDIRFDSPSGGSGTCNCSVALGDGMINLASGFVLTNQSAQLSGPVAFGGPQAGPNVDPTNNIGPLTLSPSEIGMGITQTPVAPGKAGLKLSVTCGTHSGKARLVVLAGDGTAQTLLDDIGSNVAACP